MSQAPEGPGAAGHPDPSGVHLVGNDDLRRWMGESGHLRSYIHTLGREVVSTDYLTEILGLPPHLELVVRQLAEEDPEAGLQALSSIPFYSLCKGLFLPLSGMAPEKVAAVFGFQGDPTLDARGREELLSRFLGAEIGLSLVQKLSCLLGDPFRGSRGTLQRDSLVRLLTTVRLATERELLDRLTMVGDVAVLFAESRPSLKLDPPLTAAEVLETLRLLPDVGRTRKFELVRALLLRCGKLEAYFVAKLLLRKAGFGFDYQGGLIARALADQYGAEADQVAHAMALSDTFKVAHILATQGPAGLLKLRLQPLVAVRPALAAGTTDQIDRFPVWVERKYDGIRFMLHKSTDAHGSVLCGAYTRTRRDWLELVAGLESSIRTLPARSLILDGELYGTVLANEGARPATVYEVYGALQGERVKPVNMKFAAFDLVYLNGSDLTDLPLGARRQHLQSLLAPVTNLPLPVPIQLAQGQLANTPEDVNRLYQHFRNQGYEGLIAKDLEGRYQLGSRDSTWLKRKPVITLDLVLLGAVFAVTEKKSTGMFGSYVIGARTAEGAFADVGDVAGVDREKDAVIQAEIMREGLITGHRIERRSASGVRPGMDLRPHLVVTVKFEDVIRDEVTEELRLRSPKLVALRSDKSAAEADSLKDMEAIHLRQRMR